MAFEENSSGEYCKPQEKRKSQEFHNTRNSHIIFYRTQTCIRRVQFESTWECMECWRVRHISWSPSSLKFCKDVEINRTESYLEGQAQQHLYQLLALFVKHFHHICLIIYEGQMLTDELICNGMEGSAFTTSPNGWVTTDIFIDFFLSHFYLHVTERSLILPYDCHTTPVNLDILDLVRRSDIHLFILPQRCSLLPQPSDVSIFSPVKKSLNSEMHKYMHDYPNNVITRQLLPGISNTA